MSFRSWWPVRHRGHDWFNGSILPGGFHTLAVFVPVRTSQHERLSAIRGLVYRVRETATTTIPLKRSSYDLSPCSVGARHCRGGHRRPRAGSCPAADEVSDQHPQGQAGLRALRSAQRRRQFPAGAALSSTARAVPERCGGVVWRRPRPCESHASEPYQPDKPNKPNKPNKPCDTNESDEPRGSNGACESYDSGQYTLRASYIGTG
jgi:hypothetical protein